MKFASPQLKVTGPSDHGMKLQKLSQNILFLLQVDYLKYCVTVTGRASPCPSPGPSLRQVQGRKQVHCSPFAGSEEGPDFGPEGQRRPRQGLLSSQQQPQHAGLLQIQHGL